jgi:hypothetical protein
VEAAIALCGLVVVLTLALAGLSAVLDQIRCTDAAREAARLVALGDTGRAEQVGRQLAPSGASVDITSHGDAVRVVVSIDAADGLLPGLRLSAQADEIREPAPPPTEPVPPTTEPTTTNPKPSG